ncbi:hypothetical protein COCSUDRAFT_63069 [Coccomyxa subellipsoidea C-169]|uniref:Uncharacterized protein n=1 Tax=Coccomyxa subellipsoidea (strain C-169) TaxID=574566 RepID=I0YYR9_COCSC|nr:hypothetical protein COCSUDRAFT_63069 [Coccomyxa subellipsoidea C-169]EIE23538.1 hypothetical protein COCSUDRAFT_63069 [Coccomyxa subellipsoidea C-169]|eukprot:XP_005648082.1 hypothetical protein COCSUDRAFT_63069 [Coccomyxa subellipsoidea C-169]
MELGHGILGFHPVQQFNRYKELKDSLQKALIIDGTDTEEDAEVAASSQQTSAEEEASPERKAVLDRLEGEENPLAAGLKVESSLKMDQELTALAPIFEIKEEERVERGNEDNDSAAPIAKGHFKILEFSKKGSARAQRLEQDGLASPADLAKIQSACALALARLATLCIERLLALGRSLLAHARSRRPAEDCIDWPLESATSAGMLRAEVLQMFVAIDDLAHAYMAALPKAASGTQGGSAEEMRGGTVDQLLIGPEDHADPSTETENSGGTVDHSEEQAC